ncbi:T6SS effector amidase Tae4 family protein [uncultured Helicobacter sp.]|uniref:T6SS effector amidase Tae4 family protein n=1 Tax=uncultured Helicobacter sp. TaxID=175537 RepID=UPI00374E689B
MPNTNICKVRCGDKEATIIIQRPKFSDLKKAYEVIDDVGRSEAEEAYNRHYTETRDRIEANLMGNIALAEKRYEVIGGQAHNEFNKNPHMYINTCALRMSYSLNQSTHPIKTMKIQNTGRSYKGKDNNTYYLGVPDIIQLLKLNWKEVSWNKSTYNQVKKNIQCGCSEDFYQGMTTKQENINFFAEMQSIKRKGIVAMRGLNGFNHTTLWEVDEFVDVKLGTNANYLLDKDTLVRDFYFWELL